MDFVCLPARANVTTGTTGTDVVVLHRMAHLRICVTVSDWCLRPRVVPSRQVANRYLYNSVSVFRTPYSVQDRYNVGHAVLHKRRSLFLRLVSFPF